ncbi:MAG: hypothetical protein RR444_02530 [Oscillospiraceae bacterium]
MKLFDFMLLVKKRKKLVFSVISISFVAMLLFTVFLNKVDYEISATVKFDGNVLLITNNAPAINDKNFNRIDLKLNELDDKSALEYVQNNKNLFDDVNMVDYQQVVLKLNSNEFMNSAVNSYSFKSYLVDNHIITGFEQINIVEQTESLSIRVIADSEKKTKEIYDAVLTAMPNYVAKIMEKKIETANVAIKASIDTDQAEADRLVNEYAQLKKTTGFTDIVNLNKGIEILNKLSSLSHNINANGDVVDKFERLLSNEIAPDLVIKSADFSGLKLTKTLVTYVIIEIIASILIAFLAVFITECYSKAKMIHQ